MIAKQGFRISFSFSHVIQEPASISLNRCVDMSHTHTHTQTQEGKLSKWQSPLKFSYTY